MGSGVRRTCACVCTHVCVGNVLRSRSSLVCTSPSHLGGSDRDKPATGSEEVKVGGRGGVDSVGEEERWGGVRGGSASGGVATSSSGSSL